MATIILPHRWQRQPPGYVRPDWGHPLLRNCKALFNPALGIMRNAVTGDIWTPGGSASIVATASNRGPARVASYVPASQHTFTGHSEVSGTNPETVAIWLPRVGPKSTNGHIYFASNSGASVYLQVSSNVVFNVYSFASAETAFASDVAWYSTTNRSIVFTRSSASRAVYADGWNVATPAASTGWGSGSKNFRIGDWFSAGWEADADISLFLWLYGTQWGRGESEAFHRAPYQVFRPDPRRLYFFDAGGGPTTHEVAVTHGVSGGYAAALQAQYKVGMLAPASLGYTAALQGQYKLGIANAVSAGYAASLQAQYKTEIVLPAALGFAAAVEVSTVGAINVSAAYSATLNALSAITGRYGVAATFSVQKAFAASPAGSQYKVVASYALQKAFAAGFSVGGAGIWTTVAGQSSTWTTVTGSSSTWSDV